jgi:phosphotransacetylase
MKWRSLMHKDFDSLLNAGLNLCAPRLAIVAGANDEHVLQAVFAAQDKGFLNPVLLGDKEEITRSIKEIGRLEKPYEIVHVEGGVNPASVAVQLVRGGKGDFIVKGRMETKDLLKPILNKETGLNSKRFITHFGLMQLKNHHKLLSISDCVVIPHPSLEDKAKIISVCAATLRKLGYEKPVIGVMCAVETVSEKMPETVDAQSLQRLAESGEFGDAVVIGPISYDLATDKESAAIKGYGSPYAGEVDMLLVPHMVTGNAMSKIWNSEPENKMAGCIVGADIPIALTSRSASMEQKLNSIMLCALIS